MTEPSDGNPPIPSKDAVTLPAELPPAWLRQIQEASKPTLWTAVFGSAVLAALIGLASSALTARMTISGNEILERQKTNLQLQQEKARAQIKAYQTLGLRLDDLRGAFYGYLVLVKIDADHGMINKDRSALISQLNQIGVSQRNLIDARHDPTIDNSQLCKDIDDWLVKFTPALAHGAGDPASLLQYSGLQADLPNLADRARQKADRVSIPAQ